MQPAAPTALTNNRLPDWQARLGALVTAAQNRPFEWGQNDCCLWGADVVCAITGRDVAAPYRGTYTTFEGAMNLLDKLGGLYGVATHVYGLGVPYTAVYARHGDIVITRGFDDVPVLALANGCTAVAPGPAGLVALPLVGRCSMVWRV